MTALLQGGLLGNVSVCGSGVPVQLTIVLLLVSEGVGFRVPVSGEMILDCGELVQSGTGVPSGACYHLVNGCFMSIAL